MRVFLSYHRDDEAVASAVRQTLEAEGFEVWDPHGVLPGEDAHRAAAKALRDAQALVVFLSPDAIRSSWLRDEVSYALGEERFEGRLIPVVVKPVPKIPWILGKLPMVQLTPDARSAGKRIVAALRRKPNAA
ncbi:MAG: toll/interleukin-1 receptor domain-containing protein [Planctomycetota bacterium]